jgi:sugar phosphate permease
MDATEAWIDLRLWSVSAFRTVSFTVAAVFGLHLRGTLPESLARLNTMVGFAAFAILWITTLVATRAGRRHYRHRQISPTYSASRLESTIVAGSLNGACVYAVLSVAAGVAIHTPQAIAAIAVFSVLGIAVASAIGGFVGIAYGAGEACLLRVSRALLDREQPDPPIATT